VSESIPKLIECIQLGPGAAKQAEEDLSRPRFSLMRRIRKIREGLAKWASRP
jgi:hypothetical protein